MGIEGADEVFDGGQGGAFLVFIEELKGRFAGKERLPIGDDFRGKDVGVNINDHG
jgi:hypothetical protein